MALLTRVPAAVGEEPEAARPIGRADALRLAAAGGPGVGVAAAPRLAIVEAERRAGGILVRPAHLEVAGGYRTGPLGSGANVGVTVLQDLSLRRLGDERRRAAGAQKHEIDTDVQRARLDAAARGAFAFIAALEAKELVRLRRESLAHAERVVALVRARVTAGVDKPYELALAQGDLGTAHAGVLDAEGMQVEALAELRFALALPAAENVEAVGDLYATEERHLDETTAIHAAERAHPLLAWAAARVAVAEQEVRLTHATLGASLAIGASYVREGTGDHVVSAIVNLPLPLFDPAAFEAARMRAGAQTAQAQRVRVQAEVERDIRLAIHEREHSREVRDALRTHALGPAREAFRLAKVQYEVGTQDVAPLLYARQRLVVVEEQLAKVAADVQRADVRLGRAAGWLLGGTP